MSTISDFSQIRNWRQGAYVPTTNPHETPERNRHDRSAFQPFPAVTLHRARNVRLQIVYTNASRIVGLPESEHLYYSCIGVSLDRFTI